MTRTHPGDARCEVPRCEVLFVEGTGRGFISQYTHALALLMHRAGQSVCLVTRRDCEFADWSMPFPREACLAPGARAWATLARRVAAHRPRVVHFQWMSRPWLGLALVRAWQRRGISVVYTPHNILPHCARWASLPFYRAWYRAMDGIVARDRHIAWALEEVLEIGRDRLAVLAQNPNVVSLDAETHPRVAATPAREPGEVRLLVFGHGGRGKGLAQLCDALLSRAWPRTLHLVLAGEQATCGVDPDRLRALAGHVRTTVLDGYVPAAAIAGLFAGADALVLPYLKICKSPLVNLAADHGVPVIRSDRVHADAFEEGVDGVTVPHGDVAALARALSALAAGARWAARAGSAEPRRTRAVAGFVHGHRALYARVARPAPQPVPARLGTSLNAGLEG